MLLSLLVLCSVIAASDYWEGSVKTAAGALPIGILFHEKDSTLNAPAFGLVDKPMTVTSVADHRLIELHFDDRVVTADLVQDGDSIAGVAKVGSESYALELHRAAEPAKTYRTENTSIATGDATLAATLYLPKSSSAVPAIVFVAGLVPRSDAVHFLADLFASRGVAVLTYDRRKARASFSTLADDAAAAVRYARSRREIDANRVGIRGQSQGAWIAPLTATRVPVAFMIATGGGGVQPYQSETYAIPARMRADGLSDAEIAEASRYMEKLFAVGRSGDGWNELSAMMDGFRSQGSRWFGKYGSTPPSLQYLRDVWQGDFSYDPNPALKQITVPLLALEGEKDVYSPPSDTLRALEKSLGTHDKTLQIIRNATHDFHLAGTPLPMMSDEYIATILSWTLAHVGLIELAQSIEDHRIVSKDPKLIIDVDPTLKFVGSLAFDIRDAAHADRIIFADADATGSVRRLWIAQFERMLPQHVGAYDSKRNNPIQIGPLTFDQAVGRYSFAASIASKPGGEAEKTKQFLLERSMHVDADLLVARFETLTDPKNRSELIVFYWEPLGMVGDRGRFAEKARSTFAIK